MRVLLLQCSPFPRVTLLCDPCLPLLLDAKARSFKCMVKLSGDSQLPLAVYPVSSALAWVAIALGLGFRVAPFARCKGRRFTYTVAGPPG